MRLKDYGRNQKKRKEYIQPHRSSLLCCSENIFTPRSNQKIDKERCVQLKICLHFLQNTNHGITRGINSNNCWAIGSGRINEQVTIIFIWAQGNTILSHGLENTMGYETMHMIRKGQVEGVEKGNI